jgi:NADH-quinone oxidoreductase subunit N
MAAVKADLAWLAVVGVLFAAVSAYYYLRVVMVMYMREPEASGTEPRLAVSPALTVALACAFAGVLVFGVYPNPLVSLATQAVLILK